MNGLLRKVLGRVDVAQRLDPIPAQRKPWPAYVPPACAKYLTKQEREFVDELVRLLTQ
jgi:hypothetical protein